MSHIVFAGLFDKHPNLKIITHHFAGIVPMLEGRLGPGNDVMGSRTSEEDYVTLRKSLKKIKISPLANPAMPMPVPMPVLISSLPGMQSMATTMMKQKIKKHGVASLEDLRTMCLEADIKMIACQMTIDLFEFKQSEFIDGIELGGAATFLEFAGEADVTLFI